MPLNILLADDSVPAQNMGKKILVDAGYGVVTVSNGLEALRKIADAVPDMAILDIFMPGYTGLEICKRLRSSAATAGVPVILTVGKLEPYRPEDGEQVQSNAVIVKPFAASELISAVRSLIGGPLADVQPGPGGEAKGQPEPAAASDAPLHSEPTAEEMACLNSLAADSATQKPHAEVFHQEEPDEPIFASAESRPRDTEQFEPQISADAASVYGGESLLPADPNGAASLAFDPDATPSRFSASVVATLSSPSQASDRASAFGEFDQERELSAYSASEPVIEELSLPYSAHEVTGDEVIPQSAAAPIAFSALATAEFGLESTAPDPLLEPEAFASSGAAQSNILDSVSPEQNFSQFAQASAVTGEFDSASDAEQLSPEEEARREAFEALFNSPDPLPLDEVAVPQPEAAPAALASSADPLIDSRAEDALADLAGDDDACDEDACEIGRGPGIELPDQRHQHLATHIEVQPAEPGLGPTPLEAQLEPEPASAPLSVVEATPEPVAELLHEALASAEWPQAASASMPQEFIAASASRFEVAQFEPEISELVANAGGQPVPIATENPALILETVPELSPEASQPGAEDASLEAVLDEAVAVLSEAVEAEVRQHAPELIGSAVQSPLDDAGSQICRMAYMGQAVEVAPVLAPEAEEPVEATYTRAEPNSEVAPETIRSEPENSEPEVEQQFEPSMTAISSTPGVSSRLHEAERIHHAIELVFDRFKPLLVAAIVRELARHD